MSASFNFFFFFEKFILLPGYIQIHAWLKRFRRIKIVISEQWFDVFDKTGRVHIFELRLFPDFTSTNVLSLKTVIVTSSFDY